MKALTNACECVPRTGIPNRRPASTLLQGQTNCETDLPVLLQDVTNILSFSKDRHELIGNYLRGTI
jgi:hypothetical protein